MAARVKIENENTDWASFVAEGNFATLKVESKDMDNDVEFCMEEDGDQHTIFLNQTELKRLVAHLQKQIIK